MTPSYVSQLLAEDESFAEAVAVARVATLEEDVAVDNTVKATESKALKLISDRLGQVKSAMDAARIYQILNNSKRRTEEADAVPPACACASTRRRCAFASVCCG